MKYFTIFHAQASPHWFQAPLGSTLLPNNPHLTQMREINHLRRLKREDMGKGGKTHRARVGKAASTDRPQPAFSHSRPPKPVCNPLLQHPISHPFCVLCVLLRPTSVFSVSCCSTSLPHPWLNAFRSWFPRFLASLLSKNSAASHNREAIKSLGSHSCRASG